MASLYDMIPANAEGAVKPLGEWNTAKIVAKGNVVEHWLNGVKFITYERGSAAFRQAVAASKYASPETDGTSFLHPPTFVRTSKHETRAVCAGSLVNGGGKRS